MENEPLILSPKWRAFGSGLLAGIVAYLFGGIFGHFGDFRDVWGPITVAALVSSGINILAPLQRRAEKKSDE